MFARIEAGAVAAYPVDLRAEQPNTSFPWDWPGGVVNGAAYVRVLPADVPQVGHAQNFTEGMPTLVEGVWTQTWIVTDASAEEIAARTEAQAAAMRAERNSRLFATDWTQLPDAPITTDQKAAWTAYRQALRDITAQPGFPWDIQWPAVPA